MQLAGQKWDRDNLSVGSIRSGFRLEREASAKLEGSRAAGTEDLIGAGLRLAKGSTGIDGEVEAAQVGNVEDVERFRKDRQRDVVLEGELLGHANVL